MDQTRRQGGAAVAADSVESAAEGEVKLRVELATGTVDEVDLSVKLAEDSAGDTRATLKTGP